MLGLVVLVVLGFGLYRRAVDGRVRTVPVTVGSGSSLAGIGELGRAATFVQFSSAVCAPCQVARRVLAEVTADTPDVAHIEIDAEQRLDLVERLGISRTPTVLVLDAAGAVRGRIVGAPRKPELLRALHDLTTS